MKIQAVSKTVVSAFLTLVLAISSSANPNQDLLQIELPYTINDYGVIVTVSATTVGSTITVNWTAPDGHPSNDFIRLSRKNDSESSYYWTQNTGAASFGSFIVPVPNQVERFEFRFFRGTDNSRITQSSSFVANRANYSLSASPLQTATSGEITVNWSAPAGRPANDQIVISSTITNAILDQKYVGSANPGTLMFDAPPNPGEYEVRYLDTNFQSSAISQTITVMAAEGWFAGRIRISDTGEYLTGALVEALQGSVVRAAATTNANGGFNMPLSVVGTYDIRVTAAGFPTALRTGVALISGNTTEVNFDLSNRGSVAGSIARSGTGEPISGASVQLKQNSSVKAVKTTNAAGYYNFSSIDPGTYSLEAQAAGYESQTQNNLEIAAGETLGVNLSLSGGQQGNGNNLEYIYDNVGRLAAVKEQGIVTKIYNYDLTGNLLSVSSPSGNTPSIVDFSPGSGPAGTQVVIRGVNFGAAAGQNSVGFNGAPATILSESSAEITAVVPANAMTGPITVVSPQGSATSGLSFVVGVDQTRQAPSVTGFSPTVGHPGDIVTVYGTNFETGLLDNDVRFGATGSPVTSGNATSLLVPANTSSGKITVTTSYGSSTSADEFYSVPNSIDVTKVDPRGRTWFGHTKHIGIVGNDRRAAYVFDGFAGKRISLKLAYLSGVVKIEIFRPDGQLLASGSFSPNGGKNSWFIDAKMTPLTGTYTIIATPLGSSPTYFATVLYDVPPDIVEEMPLNSFRQVAFTTPGQNGNLTFNAEAGQRILIKVSDHTFDGTLNVQQLIAGGRPDSGTTNFGRYVTGTGFGAFNDTYTVEGVSIPVTGTYNIGLNPSGPSVGSMTVSLYIVPGDAEYTMDIGSSKTVYTSARGQNALVYFDAVAGQRVSLLARNLTYPAGFTLTMNKPDGSYLLGNPVNVVNNTFVDTVNLPVTGRYKIFMNPPGFDTGSVTFDLFDVPPNLVGTTSINGPPVMVTAAVPGHNPSVTFSATQGQQARFSVSSASVPNGTYLNIKRPNGSLFRFAAINAGAALIESTTLPDTGTYTVEIDPTGTNLGSAAILVGGDVFGTVTPGGTSITATINNAGQSAWLSFNGTAGQLVSAKLTNVTIAAGTASIRKSDGSVLGNAVSIQPGGVNFIDAVTLPSNGQYSVVIDPSGDNTGSATVNLYNVPADAAGSISSESSQTKITNVPGQNLMLTFAGTANQRVSVELTNTTISYGTLVIKKPDGTALASTTFNTAGGIISNVVLPLTGTYQIFVDPSIDNTGTVTIQMFGAGTGSANPTVQLTQSVSVQIGFSSNTSASASSSVSVMKGSFSGSSIESMASNAVSVQKGTFSGDLTNFQVSNSVAVATGPSITGISPAQITKNSSIVLTISGHNLETVNNLRFFKSDGSLDTTFTVTNISVNPEGTVLSATIQTTTSTIAGSRVVVVTSPTLGLSQFENVTVNTVNIAP